MECCRGSDKPKKKYRKGLWCPEEDQKLKTYLLSHGHGCWSAVAEKADSKLWSQIATHLPGRTDNEVKNHWNSYLKKKAAAAAERCAGLAPSKPTGISTIHEESSCRAFSAETSDQNTEASSADSGRPAFPEQEPSPAGTAPPCPIPRIMFADWLDMGDFTGTGGRDPPVIVSSGGASAAAASSLLSDAEDMFRFDGALQGLGEPTGVYGELLSPYEPAGQQVAGSGGLFDLDLDLDLLAMPEFCGDL
ncbi:hypothetical protein Taro_016676 [Colocasia esculenta]|uniref:Uncharacterized protein n=1 Tax=Colocasia esculenta TaxID=4460 RepID=A0A843UQV5_COLES|nr:hypothetical protein [Colocasia esculenta]